MRRLDENTARPITGTEGSYSQPFFSPDGESVAFFTNDQLMKCERPEDYGILRNADDLETSSQLNCWVSDGDGAPIYWYAGITITEALSAGHKVILFNSHPHHWAKGFRIVVGRILRSLAYMLRRPTRYYWGAPEVSAWHRYVSHDKIAVNHHRQQQNHGKDMMRRCGSGDSQDHGVEPTNQ